MGAALNANATGVWAQAKALILRDTSINPSKYTIHDMTFYKTSRTSMQEMQNSVVQQKALANDLYLNIPHLLNPPRRSGSSIPS